MTWNTSRRKDRLSKNGWAEHAENKTIMARYGRICHVCGQPGADEVDHVTPLHITGPDGDNPDNKRPIHSTPCHQQKTIAERPHPATTRRPAEKHPGLR